MGSTFFLIYPVIALAILILLGFMIKGERFQMKQAATGKIVNVKRGFSFTYLFFGPFVPLFRGHIAGFFLTLLVTLFSCGLGHLILLFCYNGMYINWLAAHGYTRTDIRQPENEPVQTLIQNQSDKMKEFPLPEAFMAEEQPARTLLPSLDLSAPWKPGAIGLKRNHPERDAAWRLLPTADSDKTFWLPGSPVLLTGMKLFEHQESQEIYLEIGIQNLSETPVTAFYLDIRGFNVLNKELVFLKDIAFLDLELAKGELFFPKQMISLGDKTVRRCEVILRHVVFQNNEIWDYESEDMFPAAKPQEAANYTDELYEALLRELEPCTGSQNTAYRFLPEEIDGGWYCGCGQLNANSDSKCCSCKIEKQTVFKIMDPSFLQEQAAVYQEEQERLRAEEEELRRKKIEARKQKIEEMQENAKEKALEAAAAAALYGQKGRKKFADFSNSAHHALHRYLYEDEDNAASQEAEAVQVETQQDGIFCSQCGCHNDADTRYCTECGAELDLL